MGRRNGSWNRQFVWPREGRKGKEDVGFFGRLTSIVNNTGPDIFIQKKRSTKPIKVDEWANWYEDTRFPLRNPRKFQRIIKFFF